MKHTVSLGSYSMLQCTLCRSLQQLSCCCCNPSWTCSHTFCFSRPSHLFMYIWQRIRSLCGCFVHTVSLHFIVVVEECVHVYVCVVVVVVPLHYTLQGKIAQTVSKALLSQLHVSATGDTGEHHQQGRALLTASPWIRPISRGPGHGWRRWVGTSNQEGKPVMSRGRQKKAGEDLFSQHKYCIFITVRQRNQGY